MNFALVQNGTVVRTGAVPSVWKLKTGQSVSGFNLLSPQEQAAEGWLPLVENRPALTAAQTYGPPVFTIGTTSVTADYPVVSRPVVDLNAQLLRDRVTAALTANATFLALAAPTNAQVVAQVRTLTKECNALIRLAAALLADVSDTA